jgi:hypothetical protein
MGRQRDSAKNHDSEGDESEEESEEESDSRPRRGRFSSTLQPKRVPRTELVEPVDFSAWPGAAEAAKIAGRHPSTIKLWRNQGKLRAQMDPSGCWRYHPDDLTEVADAPENADPASLLAAGMTSIVQQGEKAVDRVLEMTEITTAGMQHSLEIMGHELERAYARIETLEKERSELLDKSTHALEANFKHERWLKRIDHEHEMSMADKRDGSSRLQGLLEILGPIGASIAARVVGNEKLALTAEAKAISQNHGTSTPSTETIETKITRELGHLARAVRELDDSEFKAFRCMLPDAVGVALDVIRTEMDGSKIGASLAYVCREACRLPKEQFEALSPIAPKAVAIVLTELRILINEEKPS